MRTIHLLSIASLVLLAACQSNLTPSTEEFDKGEETTSVIEETEGQGTESISEEEGLTYINTDYGFRLDLPESWAGYETRSRELDWGEFGTSDSIDFGFMTTEASYPSEDGFVSLFNVSVHTPDQWIQLSGESGPTSIYLGQTDDYVFAYATAQDAPENLRMAMEATMAVKSWFSFL